MKTPTSKTTPRFLQSTVSTKFISYEHIPLEVQNEKSQLFISSAHLESQIKMYEWRRKTQIPIVKIVSFKASLSDSQKAMLDIEIESFPLRLAELKDLPLFKILYLLKESIIGFERLYSKLGSFRITPKMIALNNNNKCKVWCCDNLASNSYEKNFGTEVDFLRSIYKLFDQRANKMKNTSLFLSELNRFQTFWQVLSYIQNYAKENKITISNSCKISPNQKISTGSAKNFDPSLTMTKTPTFLVNPLSVTLSHKNNSHIIDEIRKQCETQPTSPVFKRKNLQLKTSGDTAADINGSKASSFVNKEEEITQSLMFADTAKEIKAKGLVSDKKSLFTRKYSEKGDAYNIQCYTPSLNAASSWQKESHHFGSNDYNFLGEDSDEEGDPQKIKNLFSTNNWKMTLNGLFGSQDQMKKSFHKGKETRKVDGEKKLHLLDKIGKNMIESHIQEGFDN